MPWGAPTRGTDLHLAKNTQNSAITDGPTPSGSRILNMLPILRATLLKTFVRFGGTYAATQQYY